MFDLIHAMRHAHHTSPRSPATASWPRSCSSRPWTARSSGKGTADYLWAVKEIVPFLKVDKGLADEANGVQLMKPIPDLDKLLERAAETKGIFGTKMRSVVKGPRQGHRRRRRPAVRRQADPRGGLVPIIEPEVDIQAPDKAGAERS